MWRVRGFLGSLGKAHVGNESFESYATPTPHKREQVVSKGVGSRSFQRVRPPRRWKAGFRV